jgi:hypothetical protein
MNLLPLQFQYCILVVCLQVAVVVKRNRKKENRVNHLILIAALETVSDVMVRS